MLLLAASAPALRLSTPVSSVRLASPVMQIPAERVSDAAGVYSGMVSPTTTPHVTFLDAANRAWASLEEPPAIMRRCARANWRGYAGADASSRLQKSQDTLNYAVNVAARACKASGVDVLAPTSAEMLSKATSEAEAAVSAARDAAISAAAQVPWHEVMSGVQLVRADGRPAEPVDALQGLAGKVVGLYFTASWCGPCKRFSPHLVDFYEAYKLEEAGDNFEVLMVGWDEVEEDRANYARDLGMPWLALPHEPRALTDELTLRYGVQSIPTLIVLEISADGKDAKVLTAGGRRDVEERAHLVAGSA